MNSTLHDMPQNRKVSMDLLRCICCIGVVIIHVSGIYVKDDYRYLASDSDYYMAAFFRILSCFAIPVFVMLSGAFLLHGSKVDYAVFLRKMKKRIIAPTLIFSGIWVLINYAEIIIVRLLRIDSVPKEKLSYSRPLFNWLDGKPGVTMWYMYMLIGLYLMVPIILQMKEQLSQKERIIACVGLMILSMLIEYTCSLSWILWWTEYIGYFVMGNVIFEFHYKKTSIVAPSNRRHDDIQKVFPMMSRGGECLQNVALIILDMGLLAVYYFLFRTNRVNMIPKDNNPFVILYSAILFDLFARNMNKMYSWQLASKAISLSDASYGIYLIHPILLEMFTQYMCRLKKQLPPFAVTPILTLFILSVSFIIVLMVKRITYDKYGVYFI